MRDVLLTQGTVWFLGQAGKRFGVVGSCALGLDECRWRWYRSLSARRGNRQHDEEPHEVQEERALAPAAVHAGVVRDAVLRRLGTSHHTRLLPQPFRVVQVATGKTRKDGTPDVLVLVTNRLDLDAELLAVAYRYRWAVALFFRWVKCVLGCRHLLSQGINGVRIQVYAALMASLLISLWVEQAPTKRT